MLQLMRQQPGELRFTFYAFQQTAADVKYSMRQERSIPIGTPREPNLQRIGAHGKRYLIFNPLQVTDDRRIVVSAIPSFEVLREMLA
jgi:hypothetical protein